MAWCAPPGPAAASPKSGSPARPPAPRRSLTATRARAASQFVGADNVGAAKFNADLSEWDVAKGTDFAAMVRGAQSRGGVT